ncbi:MAG: hypothetical protein J7529_13535 [Roseofilum sp. Guam]|nr:hypothetical protein [Roseofilum sp. Guam]
MQKHLDTLSNDKSIKELLNYYSSIESSHKIFFSEVSKSVKDFTGKLQNVEESELAIINKITKSTDNDPIRDKIDTLFEGKVGNPFTKEQLEEVYKNGEQRYADKIPPGYKDKDKGDKLRHNGLVYQEKFGDLVIWQQILEKAKQMSEGSEELSIIFITNDNKEDWWLIDHGKTIGPRRELIQEINRETDGKIQKFHMYKAELFLIHAKEYLGLDIKDESIKQVRNITNKVSRQRSRNRESVLDTIDYKAVYSWLKNKYIGCLVEKNTELLLEYGVVDKHTGKVLGFQIKNQVINIDFIWFDLKDYIRMKLLYNFQGAELDEMTFILVARDKKEAIFKSQKAGQKKDIDPLPLGVNVLIGFVENPDHESEAELVILSEFRGTEVS